MFYYGMLCSCCYVCVVLFGAFVALMCFALLRGVLLRAVVL